MWGSQLGGHTLQGGGCGLPPRRCPHFAKTHSGGSLLTPYGHQKGLKRSTGSNKKNISSRIFFASCLLLFTLPRFYVTTAERSSLRTGAARPSVRVLDPKSPQNSYFLETNLITFDHSILILLFRPFHSKHELRARLRDLSTTSSCRSPIWLVSRVAPSMVKGNSTLQ